MRILKATSAALFIGMFSSAAQAGWYCEAESYSASGWGSSSSRSTAVNRALHECSIRTPSNQVCYLTRCNRTRGAGDEVSGEISGADPEDRKSIIDSIDADKVVKEETLQGGL